MPVSVLEVAMPQPVTKKPRKTTTPSVENESLDLQRQLDEIERERLSVERERLTIERRRLEIEESRYISNRYSAVNQVNHSRVQDQRQTDTSPSEFELFRTAFMHNL